MSTLRGRLTASTLGVISILAVLLSMLAYNVVKSAIQQEVDDTLRLQAEQTARRIDRPRSAGVFEIFPDSEAQAADAQDQLDLPRRMSQRELLAEIINEDGQVVLSNIAGSRITKLPAQTTVTPGSNEWKARSVHLSNGVSYRMYEYASEHFIIRTVRETSEFEEFLGRLRTILACGALLAIAAALLLSRWIATATLTPIAHMTETARTIQRTGDLSRRVDHAYQDDEFIALSDSLNDMLDSLEVSRKAQREFAADASHELKTPLTSLRGNARFVASIEHSDEEVASASQAIVRDIERVVDLADSLTTLAWLDAEPPPQLEPVDIDALVSEEISRAATAHPGHIFATSGSGGTRITDASLIRRIVGNLLENAGRYTPADSVVEVALSHTDSTGLTLTVEDNGPGLSAEELGRVFDRFHRASTAGDVKGTGLGLAIVEAAAERLGGSVSASPRADEEPGLRISATIPDNPARVSQNSHTSTAE